MSQTQGVWVLAHGHPPSQTKSVQKGSATVPVAVFGVAPKTLQPTNLSNEVSGATPEPAGGTPALPPNVQCKMILARRSSPAPSARHICRTKTKKTKSLTCLRHPLPSAGRGTKPRRGGIFGGEIFNAKTQRREAAKSFLLCSHCVLALILSLMMSLLTEIDSFTPPFLQICQSYGLRRLRALRAAKNSNANYYHGVALRRGARPSRLPFSASRRKPVKLICPTMVWALRPNPQAGRPRSPQTSIAK